ncbi:MAG: hypothetical protein IJZ00_10425 [Lachnospiraceae bacterium]|nr:hypothetical protein [Lachnospiraceae bacterium]
MKNIFKNKKIQVAALAVICIAIVIAVLSLNEKRKEELVPDLTRQQLENSEEVLLFYTIHKSNGWFVEDEEAEAMKELFHELYPEGEYTWVDGEKSWFGENININLYIMRDGNVFYVEECTVEYGASSSRDCETETSEQVYTLGRLSTMDLWLLQYYVSQIDASCEYRLREEIQLESPMEGGGSIAGIGTTEEDISAKMRDGGVCYLNLPEEEELFLVLDTRYSRSIIATDSYAQTACLLFLKSYFYERADEKLRERYAAFAEFCPHSYWIFPYLY